MKLSLKDATSFPALLAAGRDAVSLLHRGEIQTLASQYGYALAYGRNAAAAIREDLASCLAQVGAASLATAASEPDVRIGLFKPEEPLFRSVIACELRADNQRTVLVELIVTQKDGAAYVTLEQISPVHR